MEEKKKKVASIILGIFVIIIFAIGFIKSKIMENNYEFIYENLTIENTSVQNTVEKEAELEENKIKVYVTGEVNSPGVIELEEGARIEDAISLAGGTTEKANLQDVNLAYCLEDGTKLYIPNINEKNVEYLTSENGENIIENNSSSSETKVNINTGDIEELKKLPGVGDSLAQKIIDYRTQNGKFKSIEDLKNVSGIGDKKFESMKEFIVLK